MPRRSVLFAIAAGLFGLAGILHAAGDRQWVTMGAIIACLALGAAALVTRRD